VQQLDSYRSLYGITYIYAIVPEGFKGIENATSLWPINPERVEVIYKEGVSVYNIREKSELIDKYRVKVGNSSIDVNPDHMLCIRDAGLDLLFESNRCHSRLESLEYEVKNIVQAQEAIYSLNKDRGAQGIITNKTRDVSGNIPLTPEEKERIREEYERKYGLSTKQAKIIISDNDLGWQPMSFNVRELMLFEGIKQNIESISDAYNYPFELLANQRGTTFANRSEATKFLYQTNIIPAANLYAQKFTRFFGLEGAKIDIDFSNVESLKEAEKEKAEALFKNIHALNVAYKYKVITREEFRQKLDMDEKPEGNTYYDGEEKETAVQNGD
jgi:HK97 family phage portal protein